jgi:hypothetical protein
VVEIPDFFSKLMRSSEKERKKQNELTNRMSLAIGWEKLSKESAGSTVKGDKSLKLASSVDWGGT